jgi:predicted NAD/FAD-binding protein
MDRSIMIIGAGIAGLSAVWIVVGGNRDDSFIEFHIIDQR